MLRSKSALRLGKAQQSRGSWPSYLLAHKIAVFWGLAALWLVYLGFSATRRPHLDALRHSRALLEASAVTGRLEALDFGQHPEDELRAAVQKAISPVSTAAHNRTCAVRESGHQSTDRAVPGRSLGTGGYETSRTRGWVHTTPC